jgi:hypothetical protein
MFKSERILRYILNKVEPSHHLISIRLYFIYCACEILFANPIDWLYAACLEYYIFFSIDSSEARKQYDEYCLSIMQTITYAHDRTHFQCTTLKRIGLLKVGFLLGFIGWNLQTQR